MSKYDIVNGKWTFRATPLDYLHCIFNEYEWLMLLKRRNKPYEEILDPLYDIARKERYEDEELADIKITMKWLGYCMIVSKSSIVMVFMIYQFMTWAGRPDALLQIPG